MEALGATDLNLLLDVGFNREVAEEAAVYWDKTDGNLASLIEKADRMDDAEIAEYGMKAKKRVKEAYSWGSICLRYNDIFTI